MYIVFFLQFQSPCYIHDSEPKVIEGITHLLYSSNIALFFTLFITESFAKHLMVLVYVSEKFNLPFP